MKLTTKNVKRFLKKMGSNGSNSPAPCGAGLKALDGLLKQKKSMEFVFNKMNTMRRNEVEISYAQWICDQLYYHEVYGAVRDPKLSTVPTFKNFKRLFEKLPEM